MFLLCFLGFLAVRILYFLGGIYSLFRALPRVTIPPFSLHHFLVRGKVRFFWGGRYGRLEVCLRRWPGVPAALFFFLRPPPCGPTGGDRLPGRAAVTGRIVFFSEMVFFSTRN